MRAGVGKGADVCIGAIGRVVPLGRDRADELAHVHIEALRAAAGGRLVSKPQGPVGRVSSGIVGGRADSLEHGRSVGVCLDGAGAKRNFRDGERQTGTCRSTGVIVASNPVTRPLPAFAGEADTSSGARLKVGDIEYPVKVG